MTPNQIIAQVSHKFGIEKEHLLGRSRSDYTVKCRIEIVKQLKELGLSFNEIGKMLNRHHTSVMNLFYKKN